MKYFFLFACIALAQTFVDGRVLFQDGFDTQLNPAWKWVRPDADDWSIRDGQLCVRSQPGRIWGGNDAENILLIQPPKQQNIQARVSVFHSPHEKWEQAGLLWYVDDDNFVKLISEHIDGQMYAVMARELDGRGRVFGKVKVPVANIQLRLIVQPNRVIGQWRIKETDKWSPCAQCDFDVPGKPRFGLFTQNGPRDQVRWVRFDSYVLADCHPADSPPRSDNQ